MDIRDINKVTCSKKMSIDAEKLRQKVSREMAKILKLKVAQDTAYWDLKEQLQQVESNHEKLQQNMVEVQMQHEAISSQYQEEQRLRHDTLIKISSCREICDVLEDYSERLKDTLSRCKTDQAALCHAYQRSGQLVQQIKTEHVELTENTRNRTRELEEKVKLMSEHQSQLLQILTTAKQQADVEINNLRGKLTTVTEQKDELVTIQNEINRQLDECRFDIKKKEEIVANLRAEMNKLMQEHNSQASEARDVLAKQEKDIKELDEANVSLKKTLSSQEQFAKTVCEQNSALQQKIAFLEDESLGLVKTRDDLKSQVEEMKSSNQKLQNTTVSLNEEKHRALQALQDITEIHKISERELQDLKAEYTKLETENAELKSKLNNAMSTTNNQATEIEELTALKATLEDKIADMNANFEKYRVVADGKNKELTDFIEAKDKEIDSKASTINQLMSEVKLSTDIRSKLEAALLKIRKDIDLERDAVLEKEKQMTNTIAHLETVVRDKDNELSEQMSIILDMRSEKERLQDKIQSMQNTIDNIQKELTRPPPRTPQMEPELDDNAVSLTPTRKQTHLMRPSSPILPQSAQFAVPRSPDANNMLYTLFSDSSMEGDTLDSAVVNRRFNAIARGERLAPAPLSALRRRAAASAHGGLKPKSAAADSQMSLSQVKNNLMNKERSFFKNKRVDKTRRLK